MDADPGAGRPRVMMYGRAGVLGAYLALLLAAACGGSDQRAGEPVAAPDGWQLVLEVDGERVVLPLARLDIYLVEDDEYPERYELHGEGVTLAGTFPLTLHVGYEEAFERLVGRRVPVEPESADPAAPKRSVLVLPDGRTLAVTGGWLEVERIAPGTTGDAGAHGRLELRVRGDGGERELRGRFAVQLAAWG
jgi:hypothetical protein